MWFTRSASRNERAQPPALLLGYAVTMELIGPSSGAIIDPENGGRLASFQVEGVELLVHTGASEFDWGCYPMVPWAGRVREGRFEWAGETHALPINMPPHAIHGTVFNRTWERVDATTLRCTLGPDWPWKGEVRSVFSMDDRAFHWRMEVHAADSPFPAMIGWHPWFRRSLGTRGPATLRFRPGRMHRRDEDGIPSGDMVKPTEGPWDDCFSDLAGPPVLVWPEGIALEVRSTCQDWVVYDEPSHALCIEPQSGAPNAFNRGAPDVVRPGRPLIHTMSFRWTVQESGAKRPR